MQTWQRKVSAVLLHNVWSCSMCVQHIACAALHHVCAALHHTLVTLHLVLPSLHQVFCSYCSASCACCPASCVLPGIMQRSRAAALHHACEALHHMLAADITALHQASGPVSS